MPRHPKKHFNYKFVNNQLTSDLPKVATYQDPNLVIPWGLTIVGETMWIANHGLLSNYCLSGKLLYHVIIPKINGNTVTATGLVTNHTTGFVITSGSNTGASYLLVASNSGVIFGFNPFVDPVNCITVIDNSSSNANYTGITIVGKYLCATDYFNNRVDVFDNNFSPVTTLPFTDLEVLNPLPANVAPYNIVNINGLIYVVYARQPEPINTITNKGEISYVSVFIHKAPNQ